jgi:hypothetical protein
VKSFLSFVTQFHLKFDHKQDYSASCQDCIDLFKSDAGTERLFGCAAHSPTARLRTQGNPVGTNCVVTERKVLAEHMAGNPSNAKKPIDLFEVLLVRNHLVSSNCVKVLQRYVLIILCIRLFLRINEATGDKESEDSSTSFINRKEFVPTGLTDKSFIMGGIHIRNGEVMSMVVKVRGKTDREFVHLKLSRDMQNPQLCPILHLLAYIYLTGYKGGHLFPTDKELQARPADGIFKTYRKYNDTLVELTECFAKILSRNRKDFGTHTLRKTAYLFAIWAMGKNWTDDTFHIIMDSARHDDETTARKYARGARSTLEQMKEQGKDIPVGTDCLKKANGLMY